MTSTACTCKNAIPSAGNCHELALKMIFNREKYNWSMKVQIEFDWYVHITGILKEKEII